jgi:hypothetical protein
MAGTLTNGSSGKSNIISTLIISKIFEESWRRKDGVHGSLLRKIDITQANTVAEFDNKLIGSKDR